MNEEGDPKGSKAVDRPRFEATEPGCKNEQERVPLKSVKVAGPSQCSPSVQSTSFGPSSLQSELDFASFIASLATNALAAMGALPEKNGLGLPQGNLQLAQQYIEIIRMLQAKTQGNLSPAESQSIQHILSDLQSTFARCAKDGHDT